MAPSFHAMIFPFPAQGHINPMLQLASSLLCRGCFVTFVDTQRSHSSVLLAAQRDSKTAAALAGEDSSPNCFRFLTISDGQPDSFRLDPSEDAVVRILDGMERQRGVLEEHIYRSRTSNKPISCIISDSFFSWALDSAESLGLLGVVFFTSSGTRLHIDSLTFSGQLTREAVERDELMNLHNVCVSKHEILALLNLPKDSVFAELGKDVVNAAARASQVLVNSFRELEAFFKITTSLASKMRFVGPLLLEGLLESKPSGDVRVRASVFGEDLDYIRWLDIQEARSVLFISFGSVADVPPAEIEEISAGIEESERKFLWVARPDREGKTHLPEGFEERTKGRGRIISWAAQVEVLNHPATGGFLTHCGWNSSLESISMGVPMLCLPLFAEQHTNRDLIVKQWRVGVDLRDSEGRVRREHVKEAARELMEGVEGMALRERATQWKDAAVRAMSDGGSSNVALSEFIDFVTNTEEKRDN